MRIPNAAGNLFSSPLRWTVAIVLLLGSAMIFGHRLRQRSDFKPSDFAMYYTGARIWLEGGDPFSRPGSLQAWINAGGRPDIMPGDVKTVFNLDWMPIIMVPSGHFILAPFAVLPPMLATKAWYVLTSLLLVAALAALMHLGGGRLLQPAGLILAAVTLLLAPTQEMFGYAQPSGPTICLCIIGLWAAKRHPWIAGVLLGAATSLKPQLGCFFLLYFLLNRNWRLVGSAAIVGAACLLIGIIPLQLRGIDWLAGWHENIALAEQAGGMNDTAPGTVSRFYQLHLDMIVDPLLHQHSQLSAVTAGLMVSLLAMAFATRRVQTDKQDFLLECSFVSVLTLLFLYHRFYDGMLMLVPFTWAMHNLNRQPITAGLLLAASLSFIVPAAATRRVALLLFHQEPQAIQQLWWTLGIEPWRTWVLLAAGLTLIAALGRRREPLGDRSADAPRLAMAV